MIPRRPGPKRVRRRPWQELRERRRKSVFLLPSLLTTGNLFCGFCAMLLTVEARYTEATLAIFVAMIMDMLDGRVARRVSLRDLRGAPAGALQRHHRQQRQAVLHRPAHPGRRRGGMLGGHPAPRRGPRPLDAGERGHRHVSGGAAHGLDVPVLELQGVRLGEAPARSHAADRRPGRDDRGHEARGVPLPRVRRLRGLRAGAAAGGGAYAGADAERSARQGTFVREKEGQGEKAMDRVIIFDTTLRDGEQSPGFSMNAMEKLEMARQLARLNVDVIEAGFPISSEEDFEATRAVARQVGTLDGAPAICGLSRVGLADIDRCWEAVKYAHKPRIHTFVATSDIHLMYKLRKSRAEILKAAVDAVRHARGYCQ